MLTLDKKTVSEFENSGVKKLKVFFIEAGCSGMKIDMQTEFEITDELIALPLEKGVPEGGGIVYYVPKTDKQYLENARITRVVKADHTGIEQTRYIFSSDDVEDACGCGTSFAFEKPTPKIDLEKLKLMREIFLKNKK